VNALQELRGRLDRLDEQLIETLGLRFEVCREIARYKGDHEVPMMQPDRVGLVRARYALLALAAGLPARVGEELYDVILAATCRMEDELIATGVQERRHL
jgi:4-amino-4-deoxychorismate mutase